MAERPLSDFIKVTHGFAFPGENFTDEPTGNLLLTQGNFAIGGGFQLGKGKYYSGSVPPVYVLPPGELVVTMTDLNKQSDTLGFPAILPEVPGLRFLHNQWVGRIVFKPGAGLDKRFLYYLMCTREYRHEILAGAMGTTVKRTAPTRIEAFTFDFPPLAEQQAVSSVLGALDDKIEVNRKRVRVLDGLARTLFKAWCVDFEPVRAKALGDPMRLPEELSALFPSRLVGTPSKDFPQVPEGWTPSTVGEHFKLTMGQSPPGSTYNETGEGVPFYQGRTDYGFRFPMRRVYCTRPTRFAEPGDTLVSVRAPVGDVNMALKRCAVGRGIAAVRHLSGARSLTYYAMDALRARFTRFDSEGTVFGSISKVDFERLPFVAPPEPVIAAFERFVAPIDERIEVCERESTTLAALRDALLPQLLRGTVRPSAR